MLVAGAFMVPKQETGAELQLLNRIDIAWKNILKKP
jgi:hypothetical protein